MDLEGIEIELSDLHFDLGNLKKYVSNQFSPGHIENRFEQEDRLMDELQTHRQTLALERIAEALEQQNRFTGACMAAKR